MGPPYAKHPSTPETIWDKAEKIEKPAGDYENLSTNVWRAHGPAREGTAGTISGPMNKVPGPVRRDALQMIQAAVIGAAATRQFGDGIVIFDRGIDELNRQWENEKSHDFYQTKRDDGDPHTPLPPKDGLRKIVVSNLDKRHEVLLDARDKEADESKTMLEKDPTEADIKKWMREGILPPGAAAAFPKYDFTDVPQFQAWRKGYDFPTGGEKRRTWADFFGPGQPGSQSVTTQVGEPGQDHGIIYGRFFIHKNDAAWPADLLGDNRGFTSDPDAGFRIGFAYNTATGEMAYTVNGSTVSTSAAGQDARDLGYGTLPWESAYPKVETLPDGRIKMTVHAVNPQTPAGAVDTTVIIDPDENYARVQGDDYPDVELYRQNPDGSTTTIGRDEMSWWDGIVTLPPFSDRDETWGGDPEPTPQPTPTPQPQPTPDPGGSHQPDPTPSPSPGPSPQWPPPGFPDWHDR